MIDTECDNIKKKTPGHSIIQSADPCFESNIFLQGGNIDFSKNRGKLRPFFCCVT